jgi:hypothetical protein
MEKLNWRRPCDALLAHFLRVWVVPIDPPRCVRNSLVGPPFTPFRRVVRFTADHCKCTQSGRSRVSRTDLGVDAITLRRLARPQITLVQRPCADKGCAGPDRRAAAGRGPAPSAGFALRVVFEHLQGVLGSPPSRSGARRSKVSGRRAEPSHPRYDAPALTDSASIRRNVVLSRRTNCDEVDLALNRKTQRAQLWQPGVAIFVGDEGEDADHPCFEVTGNRGPSVRVSPIDHIGRTIHRSVHVIAVEEAGCRDPDLNLSGHVPRTPQWARRPRYKWPAENAFIRVLAPS